MNPYEVMFIADPTLEGEEAIDSLIERFGRLIVDQGGQVTAVDKWGKKRLAYEIKGHTEGYYVVITFRATVPIVDELNRVMRLADGVIRHLVVRLERDPATDDAAADDAAPEAAAEPAAQAEVDSDQAQEGQVESAEAEQEQ